MKFEVVNELVITESVIEIMLNKLREEINEETLCMESKELEAKDFKMVL